ncbi:MAG TPA: hypothetical protein VJS69_13540 [Candidatus Krumholzibacteria bacterium]|nr:hypothetical protein [Candidatus Krumholzibacteria bacterium]
MRVINLNERGSAMVTALIFLVGLAVAGAVVAMVATSHRRVTQNDYTHSRSYYSADAGSESAINWIRLAAVPPTITNLATGAVRNQNSYTHLDVNGDSENNMFKYDATYDRVHFRPGWSKEYRDFDYTVNANGASAQTSSAQVEVQVSRLYKVEY